MKTSKKPKILPFFENATDNMHCLQSCLKSLLAFYFPSQIFDDRTIDTKTIQEGGWSWLPPAVVWLSELGLSVELYSPFDYGRLASEGEVFMKEFRSPEMYEIEEKNGTYRNLALIQSSAKEMINRGLWINDCLSKDHLKVYLLNNEVFAIGKTIHEWLSGRTGYTSHYVLVINEYMPGVWRVHDPGLPGIENRKICQEFNNRNIFGDVLLVKRGK